MTVKSAVYLCYAILSVCQNVCYLWFRSELAQISYVHPLVPDLSPQRDVRRRAIFQLLPCLKKFVHLSSYRLPKLTFSLNLSAVLRVYWHHFGRPWLLCQHWVLLLQALCGLKSGDYGCVLLTLASNFVNFASSNDVFNRLTAITWRGSHLCMHRSPMRVKQFTCMVHHVLDRLLSEDKDQLWLQNPKNFVCFTSQVIFHKDSWDWS